MQERERFAGMSRIAEKKCNLFSAACEDRKVTPQGTASFVFGNRSLEMCAAHREVLDRPGERKLP